MQYVSCCLRLFSLSTVSWRVIILCFIHSMNVIFLMSAICQIAQDGLGCGGEQTGSTGTSWETELIDNYNMRVWRHKSQVRKISALQKPAFQTH